MRRAFDPAASGAAGSPALAYALGLAIGLASLGALVPRGYLGGSGGEFAWPRGDLPGNVAGAYAFVDDGWRFPLFDTRRLNVPDGANVIFTDSAPLAGLVAKLANRLTGLRFNYLGLWFGLGWLGQALAAVFLVRQMGVRGAGWAGVAAVLALATPAFLARHLPPTGHLVLSAHFLLLLALGLYARTVRTEPSRGTWAAWLALLGALVWTHAYLVAPAALVFAAALVDAWRKGKARPGPLLAVGAAAAAWVLALAWIGGYFGYAPGSGGFGHYSMNVLSPLVPQRSGLFGGDILDATGGQYEGLNYLGFGALALVALAAALAPREAARLVSRHPGLAGAAVVLTALAISHRVFVGHHLVLALPVNPDAPAVAALRSSGRLFWTVGYGAVFGALVLAARHLWARWPVAVPLAAAALALAQAADARPYWTALRRQLAGEEPRPWERSLRALVRAHERVLVFPRRPECGDGYDPYQLIGTLSLYAAEAGVPINTAYLARWWAPPDCAGELRRLSEVRLGRGDLLVALVPPAQRREAISATAAVAAASGAACRDDITVFAGTPAIACSLSAERMEAARFDRDAPCADIEFGAAGPAGYAAQGLSAIEPWGRWTDGPAAAIRCRLPADRPRPRHVVLEARGYAPGGAQVVTATVNGRRAGTHEFPHGSPKTVRLEIPPDGAADLVLDLQIAHPSSPQEHGESGDVRALGLALLRMRLE